MKHQRRRQRRRKGRVGMHEIVQKVVADIEKKARAQVDDEPIAQRRVGRSVKQSWDCSQIADEEVGEDDRLKGNGLRMKSWKRIWNEEKRKEFPCRQKFCRRCLSWEYMSGCLNVKN